jgi:ribose 1,5-bisphosphokinase
MPSFSLAMSHISSVLGEHPKGALVLVVGPSGSGKDTIISMVREALTKEPKFVFPRRVITRPAQADAEDHDTLDVASFEAQRAAGHFALSWGAHGLFYGIPLASLAPVRDGATAIINVSRGVIGEAETLGCRVTVMAITCRPELLAERIAKRGRETADEIINRLKRDAPIHVTTARLVEIANETTIDAIKDAVLDAVRSA